ncbi:DUF2283 domain-containing protein [Candidatus Pacearchaeota archaeon]|nr:DUF2283 domain-containing protein [Candidatus Pacearchaeota archaeon]
MKIEYDKYADAVYIEFSKGEFAKNKKIDNDTIIDLDENDNILGIEIINVSKRLSKDFISNIIVSNI